MDQTKRKPYEMQFWRENKIDDEQCTLFEAGVEKMTREVKKDDAFNICTDLSMHSQIYPADAWLPFSDDEIQTQRPILLLT